MLGFRTIQYAITALRDQGQSVAAVLARQVEVEASRVALERERFAWERDRAERDDARRAAWEREQSGADLPEVIVTAVQDLAGRDAALKAQLVKWARTRLARDIEPGTVAAELRTGIPARAL